MKSLFLNTITTVLIFFCSCKSSLITNDKSYRINVDSIEYTLSKSPYDFKSVKYKIIKDSENSDYIIYVSFKEDSSRIVKYDNLKSKKEYPEELEMKLKQYFSSINVVFEISENYKYKYGFSIPLFIKVR